MKKLYFLRHGLSQTNVDRVWGGRIDTPLTEEGKAQAAAAGRLIKEKGILIDVIIRSPLSRTRDTANIVAAEIGYPKDKILVNDLLIERSFGELDGKPVGNFFDEHVYQDLDEVPGAETIQALQERAQQFYDYVKSLENYDTVLIVGHGAHGRALRRVIEGHPYLNEYTNPLVQIPNAQLLHWV